MAYRTVVKGGDGRSQMYRQFLIDSSADVPNLPKWGTPDAEGERADIGSMAYTADMSEAYILSPSDVWTEVQ